MRRYTTLAIFNQQKIPQFFKEKKINLNLKISHLNVESHFSLIFLLEFFNIDFKLKKNLNPFWHTNFNKMQNIYVDLCWWKKMCWIHKFLLKQNESKINWNFHSSAFYQEEHEGYWRDENSLFHNKRMQLLLHFLWLTRIVHEIGKLHFHFSIFPEYLFCLRKRKKGKENFPSHWNTYFFQRNWKGEEKRGRAIEKKKISQFLWQEILWWRWRESNAICYFLNLSYNCNINTKGRRNKLGKTSKKTTVFLSIFSW